VQATAVPMQEAMPTYDPGAFGQAPALGATIPQAVATEVETSQPLSSTSPTQQNVTVNIADSVIQGDVGHSAAVSGPQIPAGGLPAGWTMEQWEHYGEQWLAQNMTASQPAAQSPVQPTQSNVNDPLAGLLDELDF
ncbi:MAG: hypothetical protein NZ770_04990, partial [Candidatus Poseidoniaceae archaeon]|nr:hypothetical protein [Candidatus Poseidoniaceae archaeon]